jgi:Zn-dependent peptidase ImmA (M78 family)
MSSTSGFKPRKIKFQDIRAIAEQARKDFKIEPDQIPFPIDEIIEFNLKIDIIPIFGLNSGSDIEAFLSHDLKSMNVDASIFMDERYNKRLRFTFAHELGHYYLHQDIIRQLKYDNFDEWFDFIRNVDPDDFDWFEKQANEFAGRLLVPKKILSDKVLLFQSQIEAYLKKCKGNDLEIDRDFILLGISRKICNDFLVSAEVIKARIYIEKILDELDLNRLFIE